MPHRIHYITFYHKKGNYREEKQKNCKYAFLINGKYFLRLIVQANSGYK